MTYTHTSTLYSYTLSGALDAAEFRNALKRHAIELAPAEMEALIASLDRNGDGKIQYGEFVQAVQM